MKLVILTAVIAVCGAAKLDRTYLPPPSAKTAGGSPEELQAPRNSFNNGLGGIPKGSYENEFQGVVVDAAEAGVRASEHGESGLGLPRTSYGSTDSRVGAAAFKSQPSISQAGQRRPERPGLNRQNSFTSQNQGNSNTQGSFGSQSNEAFNSQSQNPQFNNFNKQGNSNSQGSFASQSNEAFNSQSQNPQFNNFNNQNSETQQFSRDPARAAQDRKAGILKFENLVDTDHYYYSYQTDNDIKAEENGDTTNGVRAQGGFSYKGDDGQTYSITYVADEGGYQPQGDHLPTPPPIPEAILRSLEQNAKDEAAGIVDDGSYDATKYNAGSEYSENTNANGKYQFSKFRGEADAASSDTFINQNQQKIADNLNGFNKQEPVSRFSQQSSDLTNSATNGQSKNGFNRQKSSNTRNEQPNKSSDNVSTYNDSTSEKFGQSSTDISNNGNTFSSFAGATIQRNEYLPPHKSISRPQNGVLQEDVSQSDKSQLREYSSDSYDDSNNFEEPSNLVPLGEQDLQSESRPDQAVNSFGQPLSKTNKLKSQIGLGSSNTQKQLSDKIRLVVGRLPSMNFQEEDSPSANVMKLNEYLPPNQINQNGRPLKQSQGFKQFNRQHSGNVDHENTKKSQNPFDSPAFEAKPQQTYGSQLPQNQRASQNENKYQPEFQTNLNRASSQSQFGFKPQKSTSMPDTELTTPFESTPFDSPAFEAKPQQTYGSQLPQNQKASQNENKYQPEFQTNLNRASSQSQFGFKPQKSTSMPDTELTTPFESTPFDYNATKRPLASSNTAHNPVSARLQPSEQFAQTQPPSFKTQSGPMSYRQNSQIDNRSRPQGFSPNSDIQYSASTSKPNYVQQQQGPDDSYVYSHPAIGFRTPQGSFSSSQLNNIRQQSAFSQSNSASLPQGSRSYPNPPVLGSRRYPNPPMLLQPAPTPSQNKGQFGDLSNRGSKAPQPPALEPVQYQPTVNGVTQAAISQFPSPTPTQSSQYNSKKTKQFQQAQPFQQQKEQTAERIQPEVSSQKYTGEIYEYNKPDQTLPPPDSTTASSSIPEDQDQLSLLQSQFGQTKLQNVPRPISQFGQSSPMFIAEPTYMQRFDKNPNIQNTQSKINFGASGVSKPFNAQPKNMFRAESARPQFISQTKIQSASSLSQQENTEPEDVKKTVSENYELEEESSEDEVTPKVPSEYVPDLKPSCCRNNAGINQANVDLPDAINEETESEKRLLQNSQPMAPFLFPSKLAQMSFSGGENKPSGFVGQAEMFTGPKQPPSFDEETGYHY